MLELNLRLFRAVDDLESCKKFAGGHSNVLRDFGITKLTSAKTDWFENPSVYVIIAEDTVTSEAMGGIRIHVADSITRLPMEAAISIIDQRVFALIDTYTPGGTAELCGLWNAKTVSGYGLGSYFLMRAGISITQTLGLTTLFALCAPHTLQISLEKGFEVEESIGNKGTFIYPKLDLVATSIIIRNTEELPLALPEEKELIFGLRANPECRRTEDGPRGNVAITYQLNKKNS